MQSSYESEISYQEEYDREKEPSLDIHEETSFSQLANVFREDKEEKEQQKGQFISCLEPVSEKPSSPFNQPALASHPPMPTKYIHPCVRNCVTKQAVCYNFSGVFCLAYDPMKEYTELYFLHVLKPLNFILTSALGGKMKDVTSLLSQLHHLLLITDRVKEIPVRKLLEWLLWKFDFT
jgi:hypothetical protein